MAYILIRGKKTANAIWTAMFRDARGKQKSRSTGIPFGGTEKEWRANKHLAQQAADTAERAAKFPQTRDRLAHMITSLQSAAEDMRAQDIDLPQAIEAYLRERRAGVKRSTYSNLVSMTGRLMRHFTSIGKPKIFMGDITSDHLMGFRDAQHSRVMMSTANLNVSFMRGFFKWARDSKEYIYRNPAEKVCYIRESKVKPRILNKRRPFENEEISALYRIANDEWRTMLILGVWTGQRLGDLALLQWEAVEFKKGKVAIYQRKTEKTVHAPLVDQLDRHLRALHQAIKPKRTDYIVPGLALKILNDPVENSSDLSREFDGLLVEAGIRPMDYRDRKKSSNKNPGDTRSQNGLSFHCLRHTTATLLVDRDVPRKEIGELLGHSSIEMTEVYLHPTVERARVNLGKVAPFAAFEDNAINVIPIDDGYIDPDSAEAMIVADAEKNRQVA